MSRSFSFVFVICVFMSLQTKAQFGVSGNYQQLTLSQWQFDEQDPFLNSLVGAEIDYWFRLKNYRWEFLASLAYQNANFTSLEGTNNTANRYGFELKNNFYILEIKGDCNCPTFSKQGQRTKKSLFLQLSPGVFYNKFDFEIQNNQMYTVDQISYQLGIGGGYDIGISDLFTITPYVNYIVSTKLDWSNQENALETYQSNTNGVLFGIRFGFRPDYVKSNGYNNRRRRR